MGSGASSQAHEAVSAAKDAELEEVCAALDTTTRARLEKALANSAKAAASEGAGDQVDDPHEDWGWDDAQHLPGKNRNNKDTDYLGEAVQRRWAAAEAEVKASAAEFEKLRASDAFAGVDWASKVVVPKPYWKHGVSVALTEFRAITLSQLTLLAALVHTLFQAVTYHDRDGSTITWDTVNLYAINTHIVMPLTKRFECSFVELVARGEQRPIWFVSHWWGTPFQETIKLMSWHAKCRELATSTAYWICTFANNQHKLGELAGGLLDTPFVRAIASARCVGTLALFDKAATTFSRVWCVLEGQMSTMEIRQKKPEYMYDLAGMLVRGFKGACLRMDLGKGDAEEKCEGNTVFPGIISKAAVTLRVEEAQASREEDKRAILHHIAGTQMEKRGEAPPKTHPKYDELNHFMREGFAGQALIKCLNDSDVETIKSILDEFPDAVNFVSKRAGSVLSVAQRDGMDPMCRATIEAAVAGK